MSSSVPSPRDVGVVIVAAGRGVRLGGAPKQFRSLGGVPMLLWAIRPFLAHRRVDRVVVTLPPETAADPPPWLADLAGERLRLVAGGAERSASVAAGLDALPSSARYVLVHDAARPFPEPTVIDEILALLRSGVSAIAAVPVADTVKEADRAADGRVVVRRTVPRHTLWRAQTPQGFSGEVLRRAHLTFAGEAATDDAALVERLGEPVVLVPDSPLNLKITTPGDLLLAEAIAAYRGHAPVPDRE